MDFVRIAEKLVDTTRQRHNLIAFIVKGGSILSIGLNDMNRTHPIYWNGEHDHGVHAEYDAINSYRGKDGGLNGSSLYVLRIRRDGSLGNSRPCEHCWRKMMKVGIKTVYYVGNDGVLIKELVR